MQATRQALRGLQRATRQQAQTRWMSGASKEESIAEAQKWKYITLVALPVCTAFAVYALAGDHEHHHEAPGFSYMHIRSKEFPWGDCALFDRDCWKHQALEQAQASEE